jgi:uncharacterized repeat protein (TIGR03943 family)
MHQRGNIVSPHDTPEVYPAVPARRRPPGRRARGGLATDLLRGSLLVALGGMLMLKVGNDTIAYYIRPDLAWLVLGAAVALLAGGTAYLLRWAVARPPAAGWRATLAESVLLVPLVAGLALPARPLDSASLEGRDLAGGGALGGTAGRLAALQTDTSQWTLLDWSVALEREADPARRRGQPVALSGFVYRGKETVPPGEFTIVRFVVTCCAADSVAVGLPVRWSGAADLAPDTWVQIEGTLDVTTAGGTAPRAIVAAASVQPIEVPARPYLYP